MASLYWLAMRQATAGSTGIRITARPHYAMMAARYMSLSKAQTPIMPTCSTGTSSYLLFSKYNNYAGGDGNGVNRIALLDPNATEIDPHQTAGGLKEMREVLTIIGPTPDVEFQSASLPYAVREWCINTAAVN